MGLSRNVVVEAPCDSCNQLENLQYSIDSCGHRICADCVVHYKGCKMCFESKGAPSSGMMRTCEIGCSKCSWRGKNDEFNGHVCDDLYAAGAEGVSSACLEVRVGAFVEPTPLVEVAMQMTPAALAELLVESFGVKMIDVFRDGSVPKSYKPLIEAATSPPTNELIFGFPWLRFASVLFDEASREQPTNYSWCEGFATLEMLSRGINAGREKIEKKSPKVIDNIAYCVSRHICGSTTETAITECIIKPGLNSVVEDTVMPKLRFALMAEHKPDALHILTAGIKEMCLGWVLSFYPYLHHASKLESTGNLLYSTEQVPLSKRREVASLICFVASKKDRIAKSSASGLYPKGVLVPKSWLVHVEQWLHGSAAYPPPICTWKLVAISNSDLALRPRKESALDLENTESDELPEDVFNMLWELFGGGPKLIVNDVACRAVSVIQETFGVSTEPCHIVLRAELFANLRESSQHLNGSLPESFPPLLTCDQTIIVEAFSHQTAWDVLLGVQTLPTLTNQLSPNDLDLFRRSVLLGHLMLEGEPQDDTAGTQTHYYYYNSKPKAPSALNRTVSSLPTAAGVPQIVVARARCKPEEFYGPPGVCGLDNLGNTCFMNSGLQCLSNIPLFRNAMLSCCPTRMSPSAGMPFVNSFVNLLRELWKGSSRSVRPNEFKEALGRLCPRFSGYEQQDAIELIEITLDKLHNELNPVSRKKYIERTDKDAESDALCLSAKYWEDFLLNNDSLIAKLFYGQEMGRFECMTCNYKSTVFDAASSLQVPIGEEVYVSVDVTVRLCKDYLNELPEAMETTFSTSKRMSIVEPEAHTQYNMREIKLRLRIPNDSNYTVLLSELRKVLLDSGVVNPSLAKAVQLFQRFSTLPDSLFSCMGQGSVKKQTKTSFHAFVAPSFHRVAEELAERQIETKEQPTQQRWIIDTPSDSSLKAFCRVMVQFVSDQGNMVAVHCHYFDRSKTTRNDIWNLARALTSDFAQRHCDDNNSDEIAKLTIGMNSGLQTDVAAGDDLLVFPANSTMDLAVVRVCIHLASGITLKPQLPPTPHESLRTVITNEEADERAKCEGRLTLEKCLRNMRETHVLKDDNAWYCPRCKEHRESTHESQLFILPEVLTVHLKRFKSSSFGYTMTKIDTPVVFPLQLDMQAFVDPSVAERQQTKYNLLGVVYHSGSLSYGHYTAQAFCEGSNQWVYYNDSSATCKDTTPAPEGAYILFYQRATHDGMPDSYFGKAPECEEKVAASSSSLDVSSDVTSQSLEVVATAPPPDSLDALDGEGRELAKAESKRARDEATHGIVAATVLEPD